MTHAQNRRLRMRSLLLLAPLLVAGTPSPRPLAPVLPLGQLVIGPLPPEARLSSCIPVPVRLEPVSPLPIDEIFVASLDQQPQSLGTFHRLSDCESETSVVSFTADALNQTVWYRPSTIGRVTFVASDATGLLVSGMSTPLSVVNAFTTRLAISVQPQPPRPGVPAQVTITAYDEFNRVATGYAGKVRLSSFSSVQGLPQEADFNPPGTGYRVLTVTFPMPGNYELFAQDVLLPGIQGHSSVSVQPVVLVSADRKSLGVCESTTFTLTLVGADSAPVSFCRPPNSAATAQDSAIGPFSGDCVTGILRGTQQVTWTNPRAENLTFLLQDTQVEGDLTISWAQAVSPSPDESSFSFSGTSSTVLPLTTFNEQLELRLELRDACGNPFVLPSDKTIGFAAPAPLYVGPVSQPSDGVWTAPLALAACPANLAELTIQPTLNGTVSPVSPDARFKLSVQPDCSEPLVELSLRSKETSAAAEPGSTVEFEAKLENKGLPAVTAGVLQLEVAGLTLLKGTVDGAPLTLQGTSAVLPTLEKDKTLTVRITAQTPTQPGQELTVTAWYTASNGAPLTPEKSVTFDTGDLSVDVGCTSSAASLPSHLISWGILLLVASRPWERSRRLRRRERSDR